MNLNLHNQPNSIELSVKKNVPRPHTVKCVFKKRDKIQKHLSITRISIKNYQSGGNNNTRL